MNISSIRRALYELEIGYDNLLTNYARGIATLRQAIEEAELQAIEDAEKPVDLNSIELYRMQMAAISVASLGHWQAGDPLHPDYDTVAFRDVVNLYRDYSNLHKQAEKSDPIGYADRYDIEREGHDFWVSREQGKGSVALYTAPPRREWVGLTDDEYSDLYNLNYDNYVSDNIGIIDFIVIAHAIEAKLKEKNA